jgi:branched-chain amino acid transport system substrate-binding protein
MKLTDLLTKVCFLTALLGFIFPDVLAFQIPVNADSIVKIGLLIQDNKALAAKYGAEMAIRKANETGGFKGENFQLVIRSMEGPWGTGSKQAVDLIFQENVCAIMGSHDGRNAHLVEQVSAKARIVFLSAWASDPTLSQAFVPWFFSCIPNDLQQADAFINEIYVRRKLTRIATISDNGYDSKLAVESLVKKIKIAGKTEPVRFYYDNPLQDFNEILDKINKTGVEGIILFGKPPASLKFMNQMEKKKMKQRVFGAISVMDENESSVQEQEEYRNMVLFVSGNWSGPKGLTFRKEYQRLYGNVPGAVAAYSFDGMSLLIEAIRKSGTDRSEIQKTLTKIRFDGVTGPIQFDDKGKRMGKVNMMEIKNGIPVDTGRKLKNEN